MDGFERHLDAIAAHLRAAGLTVHIEYPDCLVMAAGFGDGAEYWWDTTNETWDATCITPYGDVLDGGGLTTTVSCEDPDAAKVATAMVLAVRAERRVS
jgi:hypothetical protein